MCSQYDKLSKPLTCINHWDSPVRRAFCTIVGACYFVGIKDISERQHYDKRSDETLMIGVQDAIDVLALFDLKGAGVCSKIILDEFGSAAQTLAERKRVRATMSDDLDYDAQSMSILVSLAFVLRVQTRGDTYHVMRYVIDMLYPQTQFLEEFHILLNIIKMLVNGVSICAVSQVLRDYGEGKGLNAIVRNNNQAGYTSNCGHMITSIYKEHDSDKEDTYIDRVQQKGNIHEVLKTVIFFIAIIADIQAEDKNPRHRLKDVVLKKGSYVVKRSAQSFKIYDVLETASKICSAAQLVILGAIVGAVGGLNALEWTQFSRRSIVRYADALYIRACGTIFDLFFCGDQSLVDVFTSFNSVYHSTSHRSSIQVLKKIPLILHGEQIDETAFNSYGHPDMGNTLKAIAQAVHGAQPLYQMKNILCVLVALSQDQHEHLHPLNKYVKMKIAMLSSAYYHGPNYKECAQKIMSRLALQHDDINEKFNALIEGCELLKIFDLDASLTIYESWLLRRQQELARASSQQASKLPYDNEFVDHMKKSIQNHNHANDAKPNAAGRFSLNSAQGIITFYGMQPDKQQQTILDQPFKQRLQNLMEKLQGVSYDMTHESVRFFFYLVKDLFSQYADVAYDEIDESPLQIFASNDGIRWLYGCENIFDNRNMSRGGQNVVLDKNLIFLHAKDVNVISEAAILNPLCARTSAWQSTHFKYGVDIIWIDKDFAQEYRWMLADAAQYAYDLCVTMERDNLIDTSPLALPKKTCDTLAKKHNRDFLAQWNAEDLSQDYIDGADAVNVVIEAYERQKVVMIQIVKDGSGKKHVDALKSFCVDMFKGSQYANGYIPYQTEVRQIMQGSVMEYKEKQFITRAQSQQKIYGVAQNICNVLSMAADLNDQRYYNDFWWFFSVAPPINEKMLQLFANVIPVLEAAQKEQKLVQKQKQNQEKACGQTLLFMLGTFSKNQVIACLLAAFVLCCILCMAWWALS